MIVQVEVPHCTLQQPSCHACSGSQISSLYRDMLALQAVAGSRQTAPKTNRLTVDRGQPVRAGVAKPANRLAGVQTEKLPTIVKKLAEVFGPGPEPINIAKAIEASARAKHELGSSTYKSLLQSLYFNLKRNTSLRAAVSLSLLMACY